MAKRGPGTGTHRTTEEQATVRGAADSRAGRAFAADADREVWSGRRKTFADLGDFRATSFPNVTRLEADRFYFKPEISSEFCFEDIVGNSPALRRVLEQVAIVAPTDSTVLLHGETGTGKELIARAIHNLSSRHERAYVRMNLSLIHI